MYIDNVYIPVNIMYNCVYMYIYVYMIVCYLLYTGLHVSIILPLRLIPPWALAIDPFLARARDRPQSGQGASEGQAHGGPCLEGINNKGPRRHQ